MRYSTPKTKKVNKNVNKNKNANTSFDKAMEKAVKSLSKAVKIGGSLNPTELINGGGKKKTQKTQVDLDSCNPANNTKKTCYTFQALQQIAKGWNMEHPSDLIKIPKIESETNKNILWDNIDHKLKFICNTEVCWMDQNFSPKLTEGEMEKMFRPKMPRSWRKNKYEWLSSVDIDKVMKQYEAKYQDFKFMGPSPIDFDYEYQKDKCIVNELCHIDINNLMNRGVKKVGVIFNLDTHDKPGSHWVALYLDLNKKSVYYFDSYGNSPPNEVEVLIERIQEQARKLGFEIDYQYNQVRHQYENSECGVYSIYFIIQLLEHKKTFNDIQKNRITDNFMNNKRKYYFLKGH